MHEVIGVRPRHNHSNGLVYANIAKRTHPVAEYFAAQKSQLYMACHIALPAVIGTCLVGIVADEAQREGLVLCFVHESVAQTELQVVPAPTVAVGKIVARGPINEVGACQWLKGGAIKAHARCPQLHFGSIAQAKTQQKIGLRRIAFGKRAIAQIGAAEPAALLTYLHLQIVFAHGDGRLPKTRPVGVDAQAALGLS